jgi:hypothetical protein
MLCLMNAHAKSTHQEVVCVYPDEWEKDTEDIIIKTSNNDNDIDLYSENNEEDKKPKAQDISAAIMRLCRSILLCFNESCLEG